MNMRFDGTACIEDFIKPAERVAPMDRLLDDMRRREERLQMYAKELNEAGWTVEAPK